MNTFDYIGITEGIIVALAAAAIIGFATWLFGKRLFGSGKKPEPDSQNTARKESTTDQLASQDYTFAATEPKLTDHEKKILLFSKITELEQSLAEFKNILHKTQMGSINPEPTHKTEDT